MKQSLGVSLATLVLLSNNSPVTAIKSNGPRDHKLIDRDEYEENDNSNDFMAESIAEAEKEVKEGKSDLTEQVKKLEAESVEKDAEQDHPQSA